MILQNIKALLFNQASIMYILLKIFFIWQRQTYPKLYVNLHNLRNSDASAGFLKPVGSFIRNAANINTTVSWASIRNLQLTICSKGLLYV